MFAVDCPGGGREVGGVDAVEGDMKVLRAGRGEWCVLAGAEGDE